MQIKAKVVFETCFNIHLSEEELVTLYHQARYTLPFEQRNGLVDDILTLRMLEKIAVSAVMLYDTSELVLENLDTQRDQPISQYELENVLLVHTFLKKFKANASLKHI